jgi:hypothetical protein
VGRGRRPRRAALEATVAESVDERDLSDIFWGTDPADAGEQRLEVGFDDGHDPDAHAGWAPPRPAFRHA